MFYTVHRLSVQTVKPCIHRTSALTLALQLLYRPRTHLDFNASVDTDADAWCD